MARCCFWPPALTAAYIFQVSVQSRKDHLQGNPICSTKRVPAPHHKSHGWPSGEESHSTRWAPGGLGTRWYRTLSSTQAVFSKNNRNHSLHYPSKTWLWPCQLYSRSERPLLKTWVSVTLLYHASPSFYKSMPSQSHHLEERRGFLWGIRI